MGITHFDEARVFDYALGHLTSRWTLLGEAAGSVGVGVRRVEIQPGFWSTPAHEHGAEEEIFYILSGRGISWQGGKTAEVRAGDCILYAPRRGPHSIHALEPIAFLAFGNRHHDEGLRFPRLEASMINGRVVASTAGVINRAPLQFVRESELGPPELPDGPGERPRTIVNLADVDPVHIARGHCDGTVRFLGRSVGALRTGLNHVEIAPGKESTPPHCHSAEEEIFIVLGGSGTLVLGHGDGAEATELRAGHVISRPPGTGVPHAFLGGPNGLQLLAYGTREPNDICFYARSNKVAFRGVGVIGRLEPVDFWDGED